jgi:hypothetical protein
MTEDLGCHDRLVCARRRGGGKALSSLPLRLARQMSSFMTSWIFRNSARCHEIVLFLSSSSLPPFLSAGVGSRPCHEANRVLASACHDTGPMAMPMS